MKTQAPAAAAAAAGQYYVTGNLTSSLYDPDCTFKDPTTNVKGLMQHKSGVTST
jgi:hypothetical protein